MMGFGASGWTFLDIPDLSGRVAIVTGASSGIGFETALALASRGAMTVLACRSLARGEAAIETLRANAPQATVELMALDLASLASVEGFGAAFCGRYRCLDLLINNAGVMNVPYGRTQDGFELQVGINHLGHFALTARLLRPLLAAPRSRVVTVSSNTHWVGRLDPAQLLYTHRQYSPWKAYFRSKLCNLLFAYELQRRFARSGADCDSLAAHPGYAATNLGRHRNRKRAGWRAWIRDLFAQGAAEGALPTLRAATDPEALGGQYFGPSGLFQWRGGAARVASSRASKDEDLARQLWRVSAELTGVSFRALDSTPGT